MTALPDPFPTLLVVSLVAVVAYAAVYLVRLERSEAADREANRRKALGNKGRAR